MDRAKQRVESRQKRALRLRKKLSGTLQKPRLSVFRSLKHISAQIIDDTKGVTLVYISSLGKEMTADKPEKKTDTAKRVGEAIAEKAKEKGILKVVFDRKGYPYHGRIKALAEGARSKGLEF
ncbi:MAG: 50S ribosomal protein L18 [Chitinivibrionales bacterium]|nr:50S ribosomal protein L18 [Chitinivibrionales bacterium]